MFIVYFALWVILNGKWTTEIGVFGLVFAAVLYGFSCRFMGYSFKKDLHYLRRLPATLRYGATLLAEIFKANITVIRMILDRNFEPKPQLVHFESGLVELRRRVVLADLKEPLTLEVNGAVIELDKDGAHFVSSPCPDKICVNKGIIKRAGESAVCLPQRVSVRIEGGDSEIDSVTG